MRRRVNGREHVLSFNPQPLDGAADCIASMKAADQMAAQRELPMGAHDEAAWGEAHVTAFEKFVRAETQLLALLRVAAERDETMLASMTTRT